MECSVDLVCYKNISLCSIYILKPLVKTVGRPGNEIFHIPTLGRLSAYLEMFGPPDSPERIRVYPATYSTVLERISRVEKRPGLGAYHSSR
jgi:hypothetical protein